MGTLITWFYCLDIPSVLNLILLAVFAFFLLYYYCGRHRLWKRSLGVLLLVWLLLLLRITLSRSGADIREPILVPFQSYITVGNGGNRELLRSNFMNVALFFPAGLLLTALTDRQRNAAAWWVCFAVLLTLLSVGIEYCQWRFGLGLAEVDDVIHNCLGILAGILTAIICFKQNKGACS